MAMYHGNIGIGKMMIIIEVEVISLATATCLYKVKSTLSHVSFSSSELSSAPLASLHC